MGIIVGGDNKVRIKKREWKIEVTHKNTRRRLKRLSHKQERQKLKTEYAYV